MSETKKIREFTGRHMLAFVLLFFGIIFAVNIFMATMAMRTWTGLVVKNSYVASQQFNEKLEASRVQHALNWQVDMTYRDGKLWFFLNDDKGVPVTLENVRIDLTRPIGISQDRSLVLSAEENGYSVTEDLPKGVWNVLINAEVPGRPNFEYRARLVVGPGPLPGS